MLGDKVEKLDLHHRFEMLSQASANAKKGRKTDTLGNVIATAQDPGYVTTSDDYACACCGYTRAEYVHDVTTPAKKLRASSKFSIYRDTGFHTHLSNKLTIDSAGKLTGAKCLYAVFPKAVGIASPRFDDTYACARCRNLASAFTKQHPMLKSYTIDPDMMKGWLHREHSGDDRAVKIDWSEFKNVDFFYSVGMSINDACALYKGTSLDDADAVIAKMCKTESHKTEYRQRFQLDALSSQLNATGLFLKNLLQTGRDAPYLDFLLYALQKFSEIGGAGATRNNINSLFFERVIESECFLRVRGDGNQRFVEHAQIDVSEFKGKNQAEKHTEPLATKVFPNGCAKMRADDWYDAMKRTVNHHEHLSKKIDAGETVENVITEEVMNAIFPDDLRDQKIIYRNGYVYRCGRLDKIEKINTTDEAIFSTEHAMFRAVDYVLREIISVKADLQDGKFAPAMIVIREPINNTKAASVRALIPTDLAEKHRQGIKMGEISFVMQIFDEFDLHDGIKARMIKIL
jgi:hypothetical protein